MLIVECGVLIVECGLLIVEFGVLRFDYIACQDLLSLSLLYHSPVIVVSVFSCYSVQCRSGTIMYDL